MCAFQAGRVMSESCRENAKLGPSLMEFLDVEDVDATSDQGDASTLLATSSLKDSFFEKQGEMIIVKDTGSQSFEATTQDKVTETSGNDLGISSLQEFAIFEFGGHLDDFLYFDPTGKETSIEHTTALNDDVEKMGKESAGGTLVRFLDLSIDVHATTVDAKGVDGLTDDQHSNGSLTLDIVLLTVFQTAEDVLRECVDKADRGHFTGVCRLSQRIAVQECWHSCRRGGKLLYPSAEENAKSGSRGTLALPRMCAGCGGGS